MKTIAATFSVGKAMLAFLAVALSAQATLIVNGNFELTTNGGGQLGYNTNATGWTTTGYNFLFPSGSADTTGVTGQYGNLKLWGPGTGSANGLPATSPDGGNYVGADGAFQVGAISQTVTGLTVGEFYTISFYWAAAQQSGFGCKAGNPGGCTTDQWKVTFGSQPAQFTPVASTGPNQGGFSGWMYQTMTFKADNTSDVLSFLAVGTPTGVPPFALLDGVTGLDAASAPEPGTIGLIAVGLIGLALARRKYRKKQS